MSNIGARKIEGGATGGRIELAQAHPEDLSDLLFHLLENHQRRLSKIESTGQNIRVLDPDWCRSNSVEAGQMHADVIVATYGSTYALPNKDPRANEEAINSGNLDLYLLLADGLAVGTACLVNVGNGRAELGRSASLGNVGNTLIQDLRIIDWLTSPTTSEKYHTLFTTLRSAPDRKIDENGQSFIMRGGQGVTEHWRKFPNVYVNGVAPLYLKHMMLEQFTCAYISGNSMERQPRLYVASQDDGWFIEAWHEEYGLKHPQLTDRPAASNESPPTFTAHFPPPESGLTDLVHADIVYDPQSGDDIEKALEDARKAGSPFCQIVLPIEYDTLAEQKYLIDSGYRVFGYQPADSQNAASLLFGKIKDGVHVVPTFWDANALPNPFWRNNKLQEWAEKVARSW